MNIDYLYTYDLHAITNHTVFIDYDGTLAASGSPVADPRCEDVIKQLIAQHNVVIIVSDGAPREAWAKEQGVLWPIRSAPKPASGGIEELLTRFRGPYLYIGNSLHRDGEIARRHQLPFLYVGTLGKSLSIHSPKNLPRSHPAFNQAPIFSLICDNSAFLSSFWNGFLFWKKEASYPGLADALRELGAGVLINPKKEQIQGDVIILSDARTHIASAKMAKERGLVSRILISTNACRSFDEGRELLEDPLVDVILIPSQEEKNRWAQHDPYFERAVLWSPGADSVKIHEQKTKNHCLVFARHISEKLFKEITSALWSAGFSIEVLKEKDLFTHRYSRALARAECLVYADEEAARYPEILKMAWIHGVSTVSLRTGTDMPPGYDAERGLLFTGSEDIEAVLHDYLKQKEAFNPSHDSDELLMSRAANMLLIFAQKARSSA